MTEGILRDTLANVTKVSISTDDIHIHGFIASLKTKTKNYEVANHVLVTRRRQTGHIHDAGQLAESRFNLVHRSSYDAIKLLNTRLVTLDHKRCSSLRVYDTSEDKLTRDDDDLVENHGDTTLVAHCSDANMGLESNRAARLVDLERTLLNLFRETVDAGSSTDIPLSERLIADIQSVSSDISTTGSPQVQLYIERSDHAQANALRLRHIPLIDEHSNRARQRLTDRLHFLT